MSRFWQVVHDGCFYWQIVMAVTMNVVQGRHMLHSLQGVIVTSFALMEVFMFFNLLLALDVHRQKRNGESFKAVLLYAIFIVAVGLSCAAIAINGSYEWSRQDSIAMLSVAVGVVLIAAVKGRYKWSWNGPAIRTLIGILVKAVPQVLLAWRIAADGGAGLHEAVIWMGHATAVARLVQILILNFSAGWTRSGAGLLISETANEGTWIVVTVVWYWS
jgi:hypothetical protein